MLSHWSGGTRLQRVCSVQNGRRTPLSRRACFYADEIYEHRRTDGRTDGPGDSLPSFRFSPRFLFRPISPLLSSFSFNPLSSFGFPSYPLLSPVPRSFVTACSRVNFVRLSLSLSLFAENPMMLFHREKHIPAAVYYRDRNKELRRTPLVKIWPFRGAFVTLFRGG